MFVELLQAFDTLLDHHGVLAIALLCLVVAVAAGLGYGVFVGVRAIMSRETPGRNETMEIVDRVARENVQQLGDETAHLRKQLVAMIDLYAQRGVEMGELRMLFMRSVNANEQQANIIRQYESDYQDPPIVAEAQAYLRDSVKRRSVHSGGWGNAASVGGVGDEPV